MNKHHNVICILSDGPLPVAWRDKTIQNIIIETMLDLLHYMFNPWNEIRMFNSCRNKGTGHFATTALISAQDRLRIHDCQHGSQTLYRARMPRDFKIQLSDNYKQLSRCSRVTNIPCAKGCWLVGKSYDLLMLFNFMFIPDYYTCLRRVHYSISCYYKHYEWRSK